MHLDPSMIVCECGWHVLCVDRRTGTFKCENSNCPHFGKLMNAPIEAKSPAVAGIPLSTEYLAKH
jgi:hypothetical protein